MFVALREHGAWPLFTLAGFGALHAEGLLAEEVVLAITSMAAIVLFGIGGLHLYWALGGRTGHRAALPTGTDGEPLFRPGPLMTLAVAVALVALSGLLGLRIAGVETGRWVTTVGLIAATAVLAARAVGDGGQIGFSKTDRSTAFSRADDKIFTPLVTLLAFGSGAGLLL